MNRLRKASVVAGVVVALTTMKGEAYNVYRLGGQDGNPWPAALSSAPGEYLVVGSAGQIEGRGPISTLSAYSTWNDTLTVSVDSTDGFWLRPFWIPDTLNLAQDGIRNRVPRGIFDNVAISGCNNIAGAIVKIQPMFDGDPLTAGFFTASTSENPQIRSGFFVQNSIIDLGVDYPINRIRFFPRLGRDNPKIDQILEEMDPPRLYEADIGEEDFAENFLPWFEVAGANSIHNFAGHCFWQTADSPWFRSIPRGALNSSNDPRFTILRRDTENPDVVVDIRFPVQLFQWIAVRPVNPNKNWEIAEFQVFGEGFIPRAVYTTTVLDFGEPMAWGKIRWSGRRDPEARVVIRTRSGTDPDPERYWVPSTVAGKPKELTRQEYERADINDRFTTLDEEHWSFWSAPYPWEAGLADTTLLAGSWADGTPVLSPGPERYLQVQVVFASTLWQAGRLRQLEIQFDRPAAVRVVGEVWPLDVSRTESTTFTYSVLPTLEGEQGFDRLEIFTLTRADTVRSVRVDGVEMADAHPAQILEDRIIVGFPRLQGGADTFKLIEVEFDAHVVRYGTEFQGWVFDSEADGVKQLVEAGDATVDFPGNTLGVRTRDLGAALLTQVSVAPNPFTPNGDGVNDVARFEFQLHEVSVPRQLTVRLYDLSGRLVRRLEQQDVIRGLAGESIPAPAWDGTDDHGQRVVPGVYLYRISLDVDEEEEEHLGVVSVAY